jgi:hypothetical protein
MNLRARNQYYEATSSGDDESDQEDIFEDSDEAFDEDIDQDEEVADHMMYIYF